MKKTRTLDVSMEDAGEHLKRMLDASVENLAPAERKQMAPVMPTMTWRWALVTLRRYMNAGAQVSADYCWSQKEQTVQLFISSSQHSLHRSIIVQSFFDGRLYVEAFDKAPGAPLHTAQKSVVRGLAITAGVCHPVTDWLLGADHVLLSSTPDRLVLAKNRSPEFKSENGLVFLQLRKPAKARTKKPPTSDRSDALKRALPGWQSLVTGELELPLISGSSLHILPDKARTSKGFVGGIVSQELTLLQHKVTALTPKSASLKALRMAERELVNALARVRREIEWAGQR